MTTCRLTGKAFFGSADISTKAEPLAPLESVKVVADRHGNLFNKEELLQALLAKTLPDVYSGHIAKVRDLKDVRLETRTDTDSNGLQQIRLVCPLLGTELDDGVTKSVLMWKCGHMISLRALHHTLSDQMDQRTNKDAETSNSASN